jgi:hypothetical protein
MVGRFGTAPINPHVWDGAVVFGWLRVRLVWRWACGSCKPGPIGIGTPQSNFTLINYCFITGMCVKIF